MDCWSMSVLTIGRARARLWGKYSAWTMMERPSPRTCLPSNLAVNSFKDAAESTASPKREYFPQHTSLSWRTVSSAIARTAEASSDGAFSTGRSLTARLDRCWMASYFPRPRSRTWYSDRLRPHRSGRPLEYRALPPRRLETVRDSAHDRER